VAEHELAVLVAAGEGPGIAIYAENCAGDFRTLLLNDELPGLFSLLSAGDIFQIPKARDIGSLDLGWG